MSAELLAVGRLKTSPEKFVILTAEPGLTKLTGMKGPFDEAELRDHLVTAGLTEREIAHRIAIALDHPPV